jgi:hypothetical protein
LEDIPVKEVTDAVAEQVPSQGRPATRPGYGEKRQGIVGPSLPLDGRHHAEP